MTPTIGVNLRVTGHCNQGGRKYMEDAFVVAYQQTEDQKNLEYAYFGIFDGHGGREAALFAKEHLMDYIVNQRNFWSNNDELVLKAIKDGFVAAHLAMWKEVGRWPKTMSGLPSTSGTTASVAFIKQGKLYVGHVGDSRIVLGYQVPESDVWLSRALTRDHKPESPAEKERIYSVGGRVMTKAGVERVVWNRPQLGHTGPVRRSTPFDQIPFLAVARSLGDLWSYNYVAGEFIVSPEPDVSVVPLDPRRHRCLLLASDGLWNMLSPWDAVRIVQDAELMNEAAILNSTPDSKPVICNPSKLLVERALDKWHAYRLRADNTSVVTVLLDPPGPPRSEVLLRQRVMQKLRPRDDLEGSAIPESNDKSMNSTLATQANVASSRHKTKTLETMEQDPEKRILTLPKPIVLSPRKIPLKKVKEVKPSLESLAKEGQISVPSPAAAEEVAASPSPSDDTDGPLLLSPSESSSSDSLLPLAPGLGYPDTSSTSTHHKFYQDICSFIEANRKEASLFENFCKNEARLLSLSEGSPSSHCLQNEGVVTSVKKEEDSGVNSCKRCHMQKRFPLVFGRSPHRKHCTKEGLSSPTCVESKRKSSSEDSLPPIKHLRPHNSLNTCRSQSTIGHSLPISRRKRARLKV